MKISKLLLKKIRQFLQNSIINNVIIAFSLLLNMTLQQKKSLKRKKTLFLQVLITKTTKKLLSLFKLKVSHHSFFLLMEFNFLMMDQEHKQTYQNLLKWPLKSKQLQFHHQLKYQNHLLLFMIQLSYQFLKNYQLFSPDIQFIKLKNEKKYKFF